MNCRMRCARPSCCSAPRRLNQEAIARRLGITDRMVRNHVTRALMYCRLRLDGAAPDEALSRLKAGAA